MCIYTYMYIYFHIYVYIYICFFVSFVFLFNFSKYVSKDGADPEINSYKNTFLSKGVGDEIQPFPICVCV